jgi:transcriptional regulatory protein LevR
MSKRETAAHDAQIKDVADEFRERLDMLEESGQMTALARWLTENALARIAEELQVRLGEDNAAQFVTHLAIALNRLQRGEAVAPSALVTDEVAEHPHVREVMRRVMDECEEVLDREVPDAEVDYMAVHLCALIEDA